MTDLVTKTAAALIIGNEVLSGKVSEQNVVVLAKALFCLGITMKRVVVCPDELDDIADSLTELRTKHDWVFTSGGIGPTHDDITITAIAQSFERPVVRHPELEARLRAYLTEKGREIRDADLRMTDVVEGTELLEVPEMHWSLMKVDNVFVLPGVPEIFKMKMKGVVSLLDEGNRFVSRAVYTRCVESSIADIMTEVDESFSDVMVGSYVTFKEDADYKTKVTFDAADAQRAEQAMTTFVNRLEAADVVRFG